MSRAYLCCRAPSNGDDVVAPTPSQRIRWVPYVAVAAAFGMLLLAGFTGAASLVVAIAATALAVLVSARQIPAQRAASRRPPTATAWSSSCATPRSSRRSASSPQASRTRSTRRSSTSATRAGSSATRSRTWLELLDAHADVVAAAKSGPVPAQLLDRVAEAEEHADLECLRERVPAAWERTFAGIQQVGEIVGAMRTFAHPTASKSRVDINESVRNTLIVTGNGYRYVADVSADLGELDPVLCNAGDLNQVLVNLVVNAADAVADVVGDSGARGTIGFTTELGRGTTFEFRLPAQAGR